MAIVYSSTKDLPARTEPMPPGAKPPFVRPLAHDPVTDPSDVDEFLAMLDEMKGKGRDRHKPDETAPR